MALEQRDKVEATEAGRRQRTGMAMPVRGETPGVDSQPTTAGGEPGSGAIPEAPAADAAMTPASDGIAVGAEVASEAEWKEPAAAPGDAPAVEGVTEGVANATI